MAVDRFSGLAAADGPSVADEERVGAALDLLSGPLGAAFGPAPVGLEDGLVELAELLAALVEQTESEVPLTPAAEAAAEDAPPEDTLPEDADAAAAGSPEGEATPAAGPAEPPLGADAGGSAQAVAPYEEAGLGAPFGTAPRGDFEGGQGPGLVPPESDPNLITIDGGAPLDLGALLEDATPPPVARPEDEPVVLQADDPPGTPPPRGETADGPPAPAPVEEAPELQIVA